MSEILGVSTERASRSESSSQTLALREAPIA